MQTHDFVTEGSLPEAETLHFWGILRGMFISDQCHILFPSHNCFGSSSNYFRFRKSRWMVLFQPCRDLVNMAALALSLEISFSSTVLLHKWSRVGKGLCMKTLAGLWGHWRCQSSFCHLETGLGSLRPSGQWASSIWAFFQGGWGWTPAT